MSLAGRLKTLEVPRLLFTAGERAHAWREGHPGTLGSPRHWSNPSTSESSKDFVDYFCPGQSSFSHYLPLKLQLGVPSHFCRHAIRPPLLRLLKKKKNKPRQGTQPHPSDTYTLTTSFTQVHQYHLYFLLSTPLPILSEMSTHHLPPLPQLQVLPRGIPRTRSAPHCPHHFCTPVAPYLPGSGRGTPLPYSTALHCCSRHQLG